MILKCKNQDVYNIDTEEVLNYALLPGYMQIHGASNDTFFNWFKLRYNSESNTLARQIRGKVFGGQGKRNIINTTTKSLSLSDCYWISSEGSNSISKPVLFEEVSPYYTKFWKSKSEGKYKGESIPTLYVGGYLPKEWKNKSILWKNKSQIEVLCSDLCEACGVSVAKVKKATNGGVNVSNFTTADVMLEQADMSGRFTEDFTDEDIYNELGLLGLKMIVIDAIVGNPDRHLGNFGYLRDTNTGEYLGMAPLYDFDMALTSSKSDDDMLIQGVGKSLALSEGAEISNVRKSDREEIYALLVQAYVYLKGRRLPEYRRFLNRTENIMKWVNEGE